MLKAIGKRAARALGYTVKRDVPPPPDEPVSDRAKALIRAMWPVATDRTLVRYGGDGDGAYLIPDDLDGIAALFSPGVDMISTFEGEMAARGMTCYLADASVAGPAAENAAFRFEPKFLGLRDEAHLMTIDAWVDRHEAGDHDLMLQMDIEGAEWTVLSSMSGRLLARFRVMVIEFHSMSMLYDPYTEQIIIDVIERLLATHHIVHNHPNNAMWMNRQDGVDVPEVIEVTFLRKDRATPTGFVNQFPHALDVINNPLKVNLVLPDAWHG